ncbi:hypothetical protein D9619_006037 [Psilocybe cf. subviscida]|uniref:Sterol regulatory element-binding protein cleavage-activating protein n=1 Tax=Psilocybe cf. subviscida TaxID=2480587 RepID=A0A8H5BXI4_9AGAR|nr:hypothetical protein D9619_006037 [Psilocybe cf. subviscida]
MEAFTGSWLNWPRTLGQRFFLQFGIHCATHQVRVILISCVVITSLFYPALDLYTSSRDASQSILDTITSTHMASDLANVWEPHGDIRIHRDAVTKAKCRDGDALRVERILIQSPVEEAFNQEILLATLDLEQRLDASASELNCLKRPDGRCLAISPLAYWNYDKGALRGDAHILDTLSASKNMSVGSIPITPQMVLAGRGSFDGGNKFDYATFLALTYFFPHSACWGASAEHAQWVQTVENIIDAEHRPQPPAPTLLALEYTLESKANGWSAISAFLYLAYIGFGGYVVWAGHKMDRVHSRLGVTFTALVEIAVSTITSLSVCALFGFKITMVPWELLPIVIVFVGAENMFNLIDAIGKTSVTLSVKQRIGEGLSRAGTSNTLKVVSYNAILGVIAVFTVGAVRQFCVFAIVVLVAHWSLAHSFFIAVLSIDIARLELEELLRHDESFATTIQPPKRETQRSKQPTTAWQKLVMTVQSLLKGRATTNISLLMLLGIAATLYYTTYTASASQSRISKPFGALYRTNAKTPPELVSTAEHIWKVLNPLQSSLLHVRTELPTVVTFSPGTSGDGGTAFTMPLSYRSRYNMLTFKFLLWIFKIMVLPIAVTTGALYALVLYLLKDTELLEAQRHTTEGEDSLFTEEADRSLLDQVSFSTLPRAFASDIEFISTSKDGKTVVSVGLQNEVIVWNADTKQHISIDASDVLLRTASTSSSSVFTVTSITLDDAGRHLAIGTGAGLIATWSINAVHGQAKPLPLLFLENSSAGVMEMKFVPKIRQYVSRKPTKTPPNTQPSSPETSSMVLLATYENGIAARWTIGDDPTLTFLSPTRPVPVVRTLLVSVAPEDRVLVAFCLQDGGLDLVQTGDYEPVMLSDSSFQPGTSMNTVTKVHACRAEINGTVKLVVAAANESNTVSLWDGLSGECISVLDETLGRVSHLRVSPVDCEKCHFCGQLPMESLCVAFSVEKVVRIYKLYLDDQTRRCSCARAHHHQQQQLKSASSRDSIGLRSRSSSTTSSQMSSPLIPRARLATAFEPTAFPVSAHGVHSRRASDKDGPRRSSELLTVPFPGALPGSGEEYDGGGGGGGGYKSGSVTPTNGTLSAWRHAVLVPLHEVGCERGEWDVRHNQLVGVRRKERVVGNAVGKKPGIELNGLKVSSMSSAAAAAGLTKATMERWELWVYDPAMAVLRSSPLAALSPTPVETSRSSMSSSRAASFDSSTSSGTAIPRLPFTRVSPLLVSSSQVLGGFGNTVGIFHFSE